MLRAHEERKEQQGSMQRAQNGVYVYPAHIGEAIGPMSALDLK